MGKNIGKAAFWYGLYMVVQLIITFFIIVIDAIKGELNFLASGDAEKIAEEFVQYISDITLPTLIFTGFIVIGVYVLHKLLKKKEKLDIGKMEWDKALFMGLVGLSFNMIVTFVLGIFIFLISLIYPDIYKLIELSNSESALVGTYSFFINLLGVGIIVPIMEEIVFRYGICGTIGKSNRTAGIIISCVFFGLAHGNPIQTIYTAILGLMMAIVYTKYENLWYAILAHMTFNSLTVVSSAFGGDVTTYIVGILATIGLVILIATRKEIRTIFKLPPQPKVVKPQPVPVGNYYGYPQQPMYGAPQVQNGYGYQMPQRPPIQPQCNPNVNPVAYQQPQQRVYNQYYNLQMQRPMQGNYPQQPIYPQGYQQMPPQGQQPIPTQGYQQKSMVQQSQQQFVNNQNANFVPPNQNR